MLVLSVHSFSYLDCVGGKQLDLRSDPVLGCAKPVWEKRTNLGVSQFCDEAILR